MAKRIAVIGGGASGLFAAVTAAEAGAFVTIYEKKERVGQKILVTGNGRCNLSNRKLSEKEYYCRYPERLSGYLRRFPVEDTLAYFGRKGLLFKERDGYLYPAAGQAALVLDLLRTAVKQTGVRVLEQAAPEELEALPGGGFAVTVQGKKERYDVLILACGSQAGEKKPYGNNGYTYARRFGHTVTELAPALVQLRCRLTEEAGRTGEAFKSVAGVRADAAVILYIDGREAARETGEVQLTEYGISGIPVFQLSRTAAYALQHGRRTDALLDFLPDFDEAVWKKKITERFMAKPGWQDGTETAESFLTGILHKKLTLLFLKRAGLRPDRPLRPEDRGKLERLLLHMKQLSLQVTGTNPLVNAQVCAGGVDLAQVDENLQSRRVPGLYFAGELLDVDGRCGGYNLQWAWTSGHIAGLAAAGGEQR